MPWRKPGPHKPNGVRAELDLGPSSADLASRCDPSRNLHQLGLHYVCKPAKDALSKIAVRQSQQKLWQWVVHDDAKLELVIKRFVEITKGNRKKMNFVMARYIQKCETAEDISKDDQCDMLGDTDFINHQIGKTENATR